MALINKNYRYYVRHHVSLRARHVKGEPLEFIRDDDEMDVRTLIDDAIKKDKAKLELSHDDEVRLTMLDVRKKDNIAIFLFRRSDPQAATQVLEHRKTRKLRAIQAEADEYPAVSAHLFLSLDKEAKAPYPTYRALVEEVPGLSKTFMQQLLYNIVKSFRYTVSGKRGQKDLQETYSIVDFAGVPSDTLGSALKGAKVPFVDLIKPGQIPGLDSSIVSPREQRMRLILKVDTKDKIMNTLNKIQDWHTKKDWAEMRVRIDLPEDRSRIIPIARTQDAKDVLFIRSEQVTTKKDIPMCSEKIHEELVDRAVELFKKKN
jgi:hypothetical protein